MSSSCNVATSRNDVRYKSSSSERSARNRIPDYCRFVIPSYRPDEFKIFFRMGRGTVERLLQYIGEAAEEHNITHLVQRTVSGGRPQIPLESKVLCTLWYLATQDSFARLADRFGISESTASDTTKAVIGVINDCLMDKLIVWPSRAEQHEISNMYEEVHNFPGVIGFIDGSHFEIKAPVQQKDDYYNRKDFHSVILQGVVTADMRFIDVFCGWPGRVHDARVFENSPLFGKGLGYCGNGHILGDGAYPILRWLMKPYRDNGQLTAAERKFNKVLSAMRSMVERAFGCLKGRFKRLRYMEHVNISDTNKTILCACVLHNICIINDDAFEEMYENEIANEQLPVGLFNANVQAEGGLKRIQITRALQQN